MSNESSYLKYRKAEVIPMMVTKLHVKTVDGYTIGHPEIQHKNVYEMIDNIYTLWAEDKITDEEKYKMLGRLMYFDLDVEVLNKYSLSDEREQEILSLITPEEIIILGTSLVEKVEKGLSED